MQPLRALSVALISLGLCSSPAFAQVQVFNACSSAPPCLSSIEEEGADTTLGVEYGSIVGVPIPVGAGEIVPTGFLIRNLGADSITFFEEDVVDANGEAITYGAFSIAGEPIPETMTPEAVKRLEKRIERLKDRLSGGVNHRWLKKLERKYGKVEARKHAKLEKLEKQIEAAKQLLEEHKNKKSRHSKKWLRNWWKRDREVYGEDDDDEDNNRNKKSRHYKNKKTRQLEKQIKHLKKKYARVEKRHNRKLTKLEKLIDRARNPKALNKRKQKRLERKLARLEAKLEALRPEPEMQAGDPVKLEKRAGNSIEVPPESSVMFDDKGFGGTLPINWELTGKTDFSQFSFPNGPGEVSMGLSFQFTMDVDGTAVPIDETVHTVPITVRFK